MYSDDDVIIGNNSLSILDVIKVSRYEKRVSITDNKDVIRKIDESCNYIIAAVSQHLPIYGITTGFGGMANVVVPPELAEELQNNLLCYHKVGVGRYLPVEDVRAAMLLRANSHMHGISAIRLEFIRRLVLFLNNKITPCIHEFGSIGASGDLTPLSYIAGAISGERYGYMVDFNGEKIDATVALERLGLAKMKFLPKEGLAMMNGTSVMTGIAANCIYDAHRMLNLALTAHAFMIQALNGSNQSFHSFIHDYKPHLGQQWAAQTMVNLLNESKLILDELGGGQNFKKDKERPIQDRYSIRCLPQFMGPIVDGINQISQQVEVELNSATDNPLIDCKNHTTYHGGNFLGQYIGTGMDHLRYYLALLTKHLDAQISLLVTPQFSNGLPQSLVGNYDNPVNMGLKGLQITANSLMPLMCFYGNSIADLFPTHAEQFNQNINSQGFSSANLARSAIEIFQNYLSVCLIFGIQAVDLRTKEEFGHYDASDVLSPATREVYLIIKDIVSSKTTRDKPYIWNDNEQQLDMHISKISNDIKYGNKIITAVNKYICSGLLSK